MARHVIQNQQLLGLYAMEEGRNKGGRPGRIKCHGRPYTAVGGRPWMALGTPRKSMMLSETRDPFEKTGCQDVRRGVIYPGKLVCLVFRSNPSLFCGCYPIIG